MTTATPPRGVPIYQKPRHRSYDTPETGGASVDDWRHRGACRSHDPELFFSDVPTDRDFAVMICETACPVTDECLAHAVATRQPCGVWGGRVFVAGIAHRTENRRRGRPKS